MSWEGTVRPPLVDQRVYPTTAAGRLPAWIGVGGTPQSVVRAAQYGMPLMLAVIGGSPAGFVQLADLYREALGRMELPELPIGMHSPGHVAATDEQAREQLYPNQAELYTRIGRERGWPPYSRIQFEQAASREGALFVGSPETVAAEDRVGGPDARPEPLPAEVLRRLAAARPADGVRAPLRRGSHPAGPRAPGGGGLLEASS